MEQKLLPVKDFAQSLGVSIWTVRSWCYSGRISSVKLGAKLLVPIEERERIIRENTRPAVGDQVRHFRSPAQVA